MWWTGETGLCLTLPPHNTSPPSPHTPPPLSSHRPLELDNVYNQDQVCVLCPLFPHVVSLNIACGWPCQVHIVLREGEGLEVPDFDDIYGSDQVSPSHTHQWVTSTLSLSSGGGGGRSRGVL